jgi:hypothetical protein
MNILALDLAERVAWAVLARDGGIVSGADGFRSKQVESHGFRALRFRNHIADIGNEAKAQTIVFKESNADDHLNWLPHLEEVGKRIGIPIRAVTSGEVKRFITGKGTASVERVKTAVETLGHAPASEGEALAIATLLYAETGRLQEEQFSFASRMNGDSARNRRRREYESEIEEMRRRDLEDD